MKSTFDLEQVLHFLNDLRVHNNKPWFDLNREPYAKAREQFERFVSHVIDEFRATDDLQDLTAKDCIARIYRDIRFSKDKSPYKTNMWATIAPGGKKSMRMGYHIALEPQGRSIIAGGMWEPSSGQLLNFRQAIDQDASRFKKIIHAKPFVEHFGELMGEKLKTAPQGYDRNHPEIELLKFKQIMVVHHYPDDQVVSDNFLDQIIEGCRAMRPFLDYLNRIG